jgi:hypothetical protein
MSDGSIDGPQHPRVAWPRTGPIGRLARLALAVFFALVLSSIADQGGPASFRDSSNLSEPITWALHVGMLVVFVLLVGQLAAATAGPGAPRAWQIGALTALAVVMAAGAVTAWIASDGVWAAPLSDLVWGFDALMLVETIVALLIAIALGTPGCEVGVWPELIGRLRPRDVAASPKAICVVGLHFIDAWEARRAGGRATMQDAGGARAETSPRRGSPPVAWHRRRPRRS